MENVIQFTRCSLSVLGKVVSSMDDVLFYSNYVASGDIITIALSVVIFLLLNSTYAVKKTNFKVFQAGIACLLVASASSILYHRMVLAVTEENILWIYLARAATYSALVWTYVCYFVYIRNLVDMKKSYRKVFNVTIFGVAIAVTVWEYISPFLKKGFYIDENLMVHQNYYQDIFRVVYVYFSISMGLLLFSYRKKFISKMLRCIVSTMTLSLLLMTYQDANMQTTYICITFSFPIFAVMFLYHHNSYEPSTGMLDHHAFDAYIHDMQKRHLSMMFLSFPDMTHERLEELSGSLFRLSDRFMMYSCTFRLRDNKMVMIYEKERNRNYENAIGKLFDNFIKLYEEKKIDFRIVLTDSVKELKYGDDYLALCEYMEKRMPLNTVYTCEEVDIQSFLKTKKILRELQDIYVKDDLNDERVKVYCQPVWKTKANKFTTAEALMRLELPEIGMVFPDQFIDMAEKHGYIHVLSKIILNKTCQYIKQLEERGYELERVSVNFSIQELHMNCFSDDIISIIKSNGVPYDKIAVELTESRNEKDFKRVKRVMEELQGKGIKFYLDDFGTGYSNFERIIGLPIDIIKFDRSLTILASKNDESRFMVGSFSEIFKKADYQILFEGVEDEKDESQCIDMDAMYLQGYKYSKPIPIEQLEEFLEKSA